MRKISINAFLHTVFSIAFFVLFATFLLFLQYDRANFQVEQENRYELISNGFISSLQFVQSEENLDNLYSHYRVRPVNSTDLALDILKKGEVLYFREWLDSRSRVFFYNDTYYIYIQQAGYNLMLQDIKPKSYDSFIAFVLFAILFLVFLSIYYFILKKLAPLKQLNKKIKKFGQGQTDIDLVIEGNDEIAAISTSFDKAVKNINSLIESKNLFMKNFMHELKTPIAKGKITLQLLPSSPDRDLLDRVFDRMDSIIKEIATLEKAKLALNHRKKLRFTQILHSAQAIILDGVKLQKDVLDFEIYGDEEMLVIVLKNLIENAYKYGDTAVQIEAKKGKVKICNPGAKLTKPLEYYTEAFNKDSKSKGLGLGLYLCQTILNLHQSRLEYTYKEGVNCFSFTLHRQS
ncbi:MAG: ArsS family sensor histidine kinase [Campylobacterota bacterium]